METTQNIQLWRIVRSRWQPRAPMFDEERMVELVNSLFEHGLLNPVHLFAADSVAYELIAGERRTRAAMALALSEIFPNHSRDDWARRMALTGIPAQGSPEYQALYDRCDTIQALVHTGEDMEHMHNLAVVENLDRSDLTPLEEARAYQSLIDAYGYRQRELAQRVGRSQGYVAQRIALLGLSEAAQAAVNTRVIGISEARALAAVPTAMQAAATAWVTKEVGKDGSPATTRQVEKGLHDLATFVDRTRWDTNLQHICTPEERNRLRLIRWALKHANLEKSAEKLLKLRRCDLGGVDLIAMQPIKVISREDFTREVVNALRPGQSRRPDLDALWADYAAEASATCETCAFAGMTVKDTKSLGGAHCPRWNNAVRGLADALKITTCLNYIRAYGLCDPVIIPVQNIPLQYLLVEAGLKLSDSPDGNWTYATNALDYKEAFERAIELKTRRDNLAAAEKKSAYIAEIEAFYTWQMTLPEADRQHLQAHACEKCRFYHPETMPPCAHVVQPRFKAYGDAPRAPSFGILVNQEGRMLPRCEGFNYRKLPWLLQSTMMSVIDDVSRLRNLLEFITRYSNAELCSGILWHGPLSWVEPTNMEIGKYNQASLVNWLMAQSAAWTDAVMVGVLEFLMDDVDILRHSRNTHVLRDAQGVKDTWAVCQWDDFCGHRGNYGWPEGYPKIWEAK